MYLKYYVITRHYSSIALELIKLLHKMYSRVLCVITLLGYFWDVVTLLYSSYRFQLNTLLE